jgi:hypothetical protein
MADIFLSYRRQDSQSATGRLADRLEAHFGAARVFRDHESIAAGEDFAAAIRRSVASSTVLLVIVGARWLAATDAAGRRRLDDPGDFVRLEIELALAAEVAVVPVLVEDAAMPAAADLAPSLQGFARCQAVELSETRWRYDVDQLIATLQGRFAIESDAPPLATRGERGSGALTHLANDLVDLSIHPKRLIGRRQTGHANDQARALTFLAVAIAAGNLALLVGLDLRVGRGASIGLAAVSFASWLAVGELVGLVVAGLLAGSLALAWRLVAGAAVYRRVAVVMAYVYSGAWLGFCAGALILGSAFQLSDPGFIDRIFEALQASASDAASTASARVPWPQPRPLRQSPFGSAGAVLILVAFALWIASAVWCIAAWGAFRNAFGASRPRAWAATALWLALVGALIGVGLWLG